MYPLLLEQFRKDRYLLWNIQEDDSGLRHQIIASLHPAIKKARADQLFYETLIFGFLWMHQWVQGPDMYDSHKLCATKLVYRGELVSIALSLA